MSVIKGGQEIGRTLFKKHGLKKGGAMEDFEVDYIIVKLKKKSSDKQKIS